MGHDILINAHSIIPSSRVNGPGKRMVVFFQGCAQNCPGCFNPDTHPFKRSLKYTSEVLFKECLLPDIEGITVSGGEPFYQAEGLLHLLKTAREEYGLSTVVYSGFTYKQLRSSPICRFCFEFIDVLIDGRYEEPKKEPTLLARGSTNQRLHFLGNCYKKEDFYMPARAEIVVGRDGTITKTGFRAC